MDNSKANILIVDDNQTNRLMLYLGVQQLGHTAKVAERGQEAIDLLRRENFDAVLLDILMPEMTGYDVLRIVKSDEQLRHIPIIVISAETDMESVAQGIELGAEDFLPKPFNPLILRARLNASLERKRYRDLERAYLDQELMLRQTEVLAAVGKMSAGMAHELNNSVSAAQRGADQIQNLVDRSLEYQRALGGAHLSRDQVAFLETLTSRAGDKRAMAAHLSPLDRNEYEVAVESSLAQGGIRSPWQYSSELVAAGISADDVQAISNRFAPEHTQLIVGWVTSALTLDAVISDVMASLSQVSTIVTALKAYSYLDQAPIQFLDVREALSNTISVLRPGFPESVSIQCEFDADTPHVKANGSQLNLVWTNILQNAVSAMDGNGLIVIQVTFDDDWVVVSIADNGPGIPQEIQGRVFEPFFTTKPPGQGAGLGLSVSHTIVVQNHRGQIGVTSRPGETRFTVRLPIEN